MTAEPRGPGVRVSAAESYRLRAALADAGLLAEGEGWDSLDVVAALALTQCTLGITLNGSQLGPRDVTTMASLERAIEVHGVRSGSAVSLSVDLGPDPDGPDRDESLERLRRRLEYRVSLAFPECSTGVSRGPDLRIYVSAADARYLPLDGRLLQIVGSAADAPKNRAGATGFVPQPFSGAEAGDEAVETVEDTVCGLVSRWDGSAWAGAAPIITVEQLSRLGYYDAHPEQVFELGDGLALLPAGCLNSYGLLSGQGRTLGTQRASVFRRESRYDPAAGRLPAFVVREILWCADEEWEEAFAASLETAVTGLAERLGVAGHWVTASDPFFLADGGQGKREFVAEVGQGQLALASVNRHGLHFVSRGFGRPGGITGCAGLGLERWQLAMDRSR